MTIIDTWKRWIHSKKWTSLKKQFRLFGKRGGIVLDSTKEKGSKGSQGTSRSHGGKGNQANQGSQGGQGSRGGQGSQGSQVVRGNDGSSGSMVGMKVNPEGKKHQGVQHIKEAYDIKETRESEENKLALIREIEEAKKAWHMAQMKLNYVTDKDQIDYAIYSLEAAEKRYEMLLRAAKRSGVSLRDEQTGRIMGAAE